MLQKVSLFINNNFITTTCRVYFVIKSKHHSYSIPWPLMDTSFSIPGFIGHPSNYVYDEHQSTLLFSCTILYPLVGSVLAKVKDVPLSCPWNSRFPAFPLFHHPRTIFLRSLEWAGTKKGTKTERFCFRSPRFIDIWGNQFEGDKWVTKYGPRFEATALFPMYLDTLAFIYVLSKRESFLSRF